MDIKDCTYEELAFELKRRDRVMAGPWPKTITLNAQLTICNDELFDTFLAEDCAFGENDIEQIWDSFVLFSDITLEIEKNGSITLADVICPNEIEPTNNEE